MKDRNKKNNEGQIVNEGLELPPPPPKHAPDSVEIPSLPQNPSQNPNRSPDSVPEPPHKK